MKYYLLLTVLSVYPLGSFLEQLDRAEILVTSFGYPLETHQTETEDNYILTIFRIPHGRNHSISNKSPVLLNHGMLGSAANYIWLGPQRSLAFILADKGYDVWLMNSRGTSYSRKHKSLSPNQREFWNFSFHEIGVYDLPAAIDYILNTTNQSSLYYVGHSQGCTSVFVMGSERPEYNNKIKMAIALAPGAIYKNFNQPLILSLLSRYPLNQLETDLPSILSTLVNTISLKQILHYAQLILSGNFQKYDYGPKVNKEKYNISSPPLYNIQNIKYPVALFSGKTDKLVTPEDVKLLAKILPNVAYYSTVPLPDFTHIDFILSKSTKSFVYKPILELLERFK
ncbi:lipase 3-like isoform X2 [Diabrotica undecimpunctata]|uniref:lipase 3-like isoform X2 n=1 Tax=Diabrotica undecimpunctata TaxID=50387 RepID=UPI003B63F196